MHHNLVIQVWNSDGSHEVLVQDNTEGIGNLIVVLSQLYPVWELEYQNKTVLTSKEWGEWKGEWDWEKSAHDVLLEIVIARIEDIKEDYQEEDSICACNQGIKLHEMDVCEDCL